MKNGFTHSLVLLVCFTLFINQSVFAQYSRFTVDAKIGTNFIQGSVTPLPGTNVTISLKYSPTRLISVSSFINTGVFWGIGDATKEVNSGIENVSTTQERFKFNTLYYSWGGSVYMNMQKLFNPLRKPKNIITYVYAGAGYIRTRSDAESLDNNNDMVRYVTFFTSHIGVELRIKGSKQLDYLASIQQNFTQTSFLDGIPYDNKNDGYTTISVGVSYHIVSDKRKSPVDWSSSCFCPTFNKSFIKQNNSSY